MNKAVIYLCRQARACSGRQTFLQLRADSFTQCKGGTVYHGHHLHQSVRFMSFVSADPSLVVHQHDAVDVTAVLARWPSPDERGAINETVYLLQDDTYLIDQALKHNIDKELWLKILPAFRRQLVTDPLSIYKTDPEFVKMIVALNASQDSKNPSGVAQLKAKLYEGILVFANDKFAPEIALVKILLSTSDLRVPHEWYPQARLKKRKFFYHGGPTNSGKTYQALKRLREADPAKGGGIYCGPLRLLALEIYEGLTRQGIYCDLLTGQEKRFIPESTHVACTVELVSVTKEFDVAVVDEIQMIANEERGHAWTRALQGLLANEIHVCGGLESYDIVKSIVEQMGDSFELVKYDRLSPLVVAEHSLRGDYSGVRKGDCIVAFSKNDLYSIKAEVERLTPYKCCLVYGQLPSETRSMQARLFNDENTGFDVMIASDAIGMGLNLNIRRVIFHTTVKRGGRVKLGSQSASGSWLHPSFVKQIAGRAGRLSSNYKFGEVTAWQEHDLAYIKACMQLDVPQISHCRIFPSIELVEEFSDHVKKTNDGVPITNLSMLLERFVKGARLDGRYVLSEHGEMRSVSNWLYTIPLSLRDRFTFANAPIKSNDPGVASMIYQYAAQYCLKRPVAINVTLPQKSPQNVLELNEICMKNNILDLYIWLSLRFPDWFVEQDKCLEMQRKIIKMIEGALEMENLGHKFCHAQEYQSIRQKISALPPIDYGNVRQIAADIMNEYEPNDLFCFPHKKTEERGGRMFSQDKNIRRNSKRRDSPYNEKVSDIKVATDSNGGESVQFSDRLRKSISDSSRRNQDRSRNKADKAEKSDEVSRFLNHIKKRDSQVSKTVNQILGNNSDNESFAPSTPIEEIKVKDVSLGMAQY